MRSAPVDDLSTGSGNLAACEQSTTFRFVEVDIVESASRRLVGATCPESSSTWPHRWMSARAWRSAGGRQVNVLGTSGPWTL
jgi:hypothetical protein